MSYVLEGPDEAQRLEEQSENPNYDCRVELQGFSVKDNSRILDAGCGSGAVTRFLAESKSSSFIVGCDLSPERIDFARRAASKLSNVELHVCDLTNLRFEPSSFDGAVCRYVLQHLAGHGRVEAALKELFRVLR